MIDDFRKQFGAKIREYRKLAGYTQEKLAEKSHTSSQTISTIERGRTFPSYQVFLNIVNSLNVPPMYLFAFDRKNEKLEDKELRIIVTEFLKRLSPEKRNMALSYIEFLSERKTK